MIERTELWGDVAELPEALQEGLDRATGHAELAALLGAPGVRRVVATGNGASYYAALALWLAALESPAGHVEVLPVPGGLVARGAFAWRPGDVLLAFSSSGEFRDVVEAIDAPGCPRPFGLVTADTGSTLGRAAGAAAVTVVWRQQGLTHTQAYCGAILAGLAVWARVSRDRRLADAVASAPGLAAAALPAALAWAGGLAPAAGPPRAAVAFGTGPGWAAALEAALLVKEVATVPCEGVETREGATTAMYALAPGQLALSLPVGAGDPLLAEAEDVCRRRGATVLRLPDPGGDRRLAAVSTFPAALAYAIRLAEDLGQDPDDPPWREAYFATARR